MSKKKYNYFLSFWVSLGLLIIGIIIEYALDGKGVNLPGWPLNFMILLVFVIYVLALHYFWKGKLKNWLSSIQAAIGAITVYTILVILMGFINQSDQNASLIVNNLGLSHINRSWYFLFISVYLLLILGLVILRRLKKLLKFRNLAFFLNHLGIWVVIAAASLGTGDLKRLTLPLLVNQQSNLAYNKKKLEKIPFTIRLNKFEVKNFNPNVIIYNYHNRKILNEAGINYTAELKNKFTYDKINFSVEKIIKNAIASDNGFIETDSANGQFAAFIKVSSPYFNDSVWVSSGNYSKPSTVALINRDIGISLSLPQKKEYTSIIDIYDSGNSIKNVHIEVNKPYNYKGYKIYQQGFDMVDNSEVSILEIVKDPWLPVVYTGFIMLLIGSTMLFWLGKKR